MCIGIVGFAEECLLETGAGPVPPAQRFADIAKIVVGGDKVGLKVNGMTKMRGGIPVQTFRRRTG